MRITCNGRRQALAVSYIPPYRCPLTFAYCDWHGNNAPAGRTTPVIVRKRCRSFNSLSKCIRRSFVAEAERYDGARTSACHHGPYNQPASKDLLKLSTQPNRPLSSPISTAAAHAEDEESSTASASDLEDSIDHKSHEETQVPPLEPDVRKDTIANRTNTSLFATSHDDVHFHKGAKRLYKRKIVMKQKNAQHECELRQNRDTPAVWTHVFNFMRVNTFPHSNKPQTYRIRGSVQALSRLQRKLRSPNIHCEPITRFGSSYTMLVSSTDEISQELAVISESDHSIRVLKEAPLSGNSRSNQSIGEKNPSPPANIDDGCSITEITLEQQQLVPRRVLFERTVNRIVKSSKHALPVSRAVEQLTDMFNEAYSTQHLVSLKAFRQAISFFERHSETRQARMLYSKMHVFGLRPSVAVYNILLRDCARHLNLTAFRHILGKMLNDRIPLNGSTWLAFLDITTEASLKLHVIRYMQKQRLLHNDNARNHVAASMVKDGFGAHLDQGGSLTEYVAALAELFGEHWHSPRAIHSLVDALAAHDHLNAAVEFLKRIQYEYGFKPNTDLLNAFLNHYTTQRDIQRAIQIVYIFHETWPGITTNAHTVDRLFRLAWATHSLHVARVAWQHACASKTHNHHMRSTLRRSIMHYLSAQKDTVADDADKSSQYTWSLNAGIAVVDGYILQRRLGGNTTTETGSGEISDQERRRCLADAYLRHSIQEVGRRRPQELLAIALEKAWIRDRERQTQAVRTVEAST